MLESNPSWPKTIQLHKVIQNPLNTMRPMGGALPHSVEEFSNQMIARLSEQQFQLVITKNIQSKEQLLSHISERSPSRWTFAIQGEREDAPFPMQLGK